MKEINDIIRAFHEANKAGLKTALATVVKVDGSSYRQPGARMLVTETGQLTGAISGGCLEGDALRRALLAIEQDRNKLVTYDTSNEDDITFGVQLGCNGIVHILFEPIHYGRQNNPVLLLEKIVRQRENAVLVTAFTPDRTKPQPGTGLLYREGEQFSNGIAFDRISTEILKVFGESCSACISMEIDGVEMELLLAFIPPVTRLIIAGAGNDVQPLAAMASILGWETTVADGRKTHATNRRFPEAREVLVAKPPALLQQVTTDPYTVFLLMTHNYNYDLELLKGLLKQEPVYIGILGPKKKFERMLDDLAKEQYTVEPAQLACIHTPVGLDIGAETAEEIAVSILAEIKAVLSGRKGASLKQRTEKIHV